MGWRTPKIGASPQDVVYVIVMIQIKVKADSVKYLSSGLYSNPMILIINNCYKYIMISRLGFL